MEIGNKYFSTINHDIDTNFRLSARLKADSFFYAVYNDNQNMLHAGHIEDISLDKLKLEQPLNSTFKQVILAIDSPIFTQVDDDDLNSEDLSLYLKYLYKAPKDGSYHKDKIKETSINTIYPLDNPHIDKILDLFPSAKLVHFSSCLIQFAMQYMDTAVYAHVEQGILHIIYVENKHLIYYNQSIVSASTDYLYYIGLVYQQFGIDRNTISLIWSGEMYPNFASNTMLKKYIRNIEFVEMKGLSLAKELNGIVTSHYFDQYAIMQCE